jgi:hypothetical protein
MINATAEAPRRTDDGRRIQAFVALVASAAYSPASARR